MLSNQTKSRIKRIRITAIVLLFFNAASAIWGGLGLIFDPSGKLMQMPLSMLRYSPFTNFLIPGIILFTFIGLFSTVTGILALVKNRYYPYLTILQGCILTLWLIVEIIMLRSFYFPLHFPYLMVGTGLILTGYALTKFLKQ